MITVKWSEHYSYIEIMLTLSLHKPIDILRLSSFQVI